jgi:hypothetical protein
MRFVVRSQTIELLSLCFWQLCGHQWRVDIRRTQIERPAQSLGLSSDQYEGGGGLVVRAPLLN